MCVRQRHTQKDEDVELGAPLASAMAPQRSSRSSSWWSELGTAALRVKNLPSVLANEAIEKRMGPDGEGGGLSRRLGLVDLILVGIGASIGAGIFVITGSVAHDAGPGMFLPHRLLPNRRVLHAFFETFSIMCHLYNYFSFPVFL